jgi:hypothetical protein
LHFVIFFGVNFFAVVDVDGQIVMFILYNLAFNLCFGRGWLGFVLGEGWSVDLFLFVTHLILILFRVVELVVPDF